MIEVPDHIRDEWHPGIRSMLEWFDSDHLPEHLSVVSQQFRDLAYTIAGSYPNGGPELTVMLRKLLEAKDAAVRVAVRYYNSGRTPKDW